MKTKIIYILLFFSFFNSGFSQYEEEKKKTLDKLTKCSQDSNMVFYLNRYSLLNQSNDFKIAYEYASKALVLSEKINFIKGKVSSFNHIGNAYWYNNNYVQALTYYYKALKINDSIKDRKGLAESYYNIGWIKVIQQKNHKEVTNLYKSLKIYEEFKDVTGISTLYNTFGQYYFNYYMETNNKKYFDSSYAYYEKAINFLKKADSKIFGQHQKFFGGLADLFALAGNYDSAIYYKTKSTEFHLKQGDSARYIYNLDDMSEFEFKLGHTDKAIKMAKLAYDYGKRVGYEEVIMSAASHLNEYYYSKKDIISAYPYFSEAIVLSDSAHKRLYSGSLNDIENEFEIEKRETSIKELKQTNEIQELKNQRGSYLLAGASVIVIIILVIVYLQAKQNKQKNIANHLLSEQNIIITQKKHEIDNSIKYAKGIQNAVLPDINDLKKQFSESFIFYHPKDVVSGDFYWVHDTDNYFYCIAADCTGHGVPGALMSIVSMDKLNQAIFEKKLTEPNQILKFLNIEIKKALKQQNDEAKQKDGLDIALVRFDKKNQTALFAGANRPLYIVREKVLTEYKADKVAIAGFTPNEFEFHQQEIKINKNDCIYLSSDGYADQFGGPDAKKFMTKNFKALLESISHKTMTEQETAIVTSHQQWKGNYEQVDDILVIGIKI